MYANRKLSLAVLGALSAGLLTACGGGGYDNSPPPAASRRRQIVGTGRPVAAAGHHDAGAELPGERH